MTEQTYAVIPERLQQVTHLDVGEHEESVGGPMCAMEAVAYVAGEPWSDTPECCCPILTGLVRSWNDGLVSDDERNKFLLTFIPRLVGTKGSEELEDRRLDLAIDWIFRVHVTIWMDHAMKWAETPRLSDYSQAIWKLPRYYKVGVTPMLRLELSDALGKVENKRVFDSHRIPSPVVLNAAWTPAWVFAEVGDHEDMRETAPALQMARMIACCAANLVPDIKREAARLSSHYAFGHFLSNLIELKDGEPLENNDDAVMKGVKDWLKVG